MRASDVRCRRGRTVGRHLRHRIFFALGVTIVMAVVVAGMVVQGATGPNGEQHAFTSFASDRFRVVWEDPARRQELARSVEEHFRLRLTLRDETGRILYGTPTDCERGRHRLDLRDGTRVLGRVEACALPHGWSHRIVFGLACLILVLWAMSGFIARWLVRPLDELVKVVRDIGDGHLDARVQLCSHGHRGELGAVAQAVNSMAEKIERQIAGQRELLAAVSHEIRSPLARLRMLVELEREGQGGPSRLDSMDVELKEMDSLVGQLLAQSRLEFQNMDLREVRAVELAMTALERAGIPAHVLVDETAGAMVRADVSLIGRALLNLLDNAEKHGRGLQRFTLKTARDSVEFEIWDKGAGFDAHVLPRALEAFVGSAQSEGLGLGLSLVQRIVQAHAGQVGVANAEQGAVVTMRLPRVEAT